MSATNKRGQGVEGSTIALLVAVFAVFVISAACGRRSRTRPVGPGNARYRWDAEWWRVPEAVARIEGRWRAWDICVSTRRRVRAPGEPSTPITIYYERLRDLPQGALVLRRHLGRR